MTSKFEKQLEDELNRMTMNLADEQVPLWLSRALAVKFLLDKVKRILMSKLPNRSNNGQ